MQTVFSVRAKPNIGLTLIAIWGVAVVITGFFKVDLKVKQMSWHGTVHSIFFGIGVAASVLGLIVLSFDFSLNEGTQFIAFVTQMIAIVALILAVLLFLGLLGDMALKYNYSVPSILLLLHNLTGLTERWLLGISVVWLMVIVNWITK